jgi:glycosyltransferase involved in cell wall biosynthesis
MEIAVIVPTYNRAHLIGATLDSILAQSYAPVEVVVVDDGSTDNTEEVVGGYASRVSYLRVPNSGPCKARNTGVAATTAPWVAFCDSDDLWRSDKLRMQVDLCLNMRSVEYCFTNFRFVVGNTWHKETKFDTLPADFWEQPRTDLGSGMFVIQYSLFSPLLSHQPVFPSTLLMKRSFFESAGRWNENLGRNPSEDIEFLFRCVVRPPIGVVTEPVVGIRKHDGNWTLDSYLSLSGFVEVLEYIRTHHDAAPLHARPLQRRIREASESAAARAFASGDFERSKEMLASIPLFERSWKQHLRALLTRTPKLGRLLLSRSHPAG